MNKENNGFMACPFCGRTDEVAIQEKGFFYELQGEHDTAALAIKCERCKVTMYDFTLSEKKYEKRVALLRRKWNKRAAVSQETEGEI